VGFRRLWLVQTMLEDWHLWFDLSDGDKDLFRYAFLMLRKRWAVPGRHVASASWSSDDEIRQRKGFCG
jgi:alpha 1,2-mannosyltransferase